MTAEQASQEVATQERKPEVVRFVSESGVAIPGDREISALWRMSQAFSRMPTIAKQYRGNAEAVMAAALTIHSLDLPVNAITIGQLDDIQGNLRPSAQLLIALAAKNGVEVWFSDDSGSKQATAFAVRSGSERVHSYTYTIEDAERSGLAKKDVWKQHPDVMLRYRAASRLLRSAFSDVVLGIPRNILDGDGVTYVDRRALEANATPVTAVDDDIPDAELVHCETPGCTIDEPHRHDPAVADQPAAGYDERPFTDDAA